MAELDLKTDQEKMKIDKFYYNETADSRSKLVQKKFQIEQSLKQDYKNKYEFEERKVDASL